MNQEHPVQRNKTVKTHLLELTTMMIRLKRTRMDIPNAAYNTTLDSSISDAIRRCGQNERLLATMEYPLCEPAMVHGIMGMKAYMLNMLYENLFCGEFDPEDVLHLYLRAREIRGYDPEQGVFNVFTAVYLNALFCDYLKKEYGSLRITERDCTLIHELLGKLSDDDRYSILFGSAKHFTFGSVAYNNRVFERLVPAVFAALKHKNIDTLLVVDTQQ